MSDLVAMPKNAASPPSIPVRMLFARMLWLWIIGAMGLGIVYLLVANVLAPMLQENMAQTQIFAYRGWQSTGVRLEADERALIRAKGQWLYTPGEWHDANGHKRYPAPDFYPMTGVPGGVLLGRVGDSGYINWIGTRGELWASEPGMIYLRINDDMLTDNEGSLYISIEVIPAPATDD